MYWTHNTYPPYLTYPYPPYLPYPTLKQGILLIDKPKGITSHDVVQKMRTLLHESKIGHLGTLDPAATGLLVLFVGKKALKTIELFQNAEKEYEARIQFGSVSTTYDAEGTIEKIIEKKGWSPPSQVQLIEILRANFTGQVSQVPPAHSAVHIAGKRAYELIRKDPEADLDLPERIVTISTMRLVSYEYPKCCLSITCSSGTYIRSIANDLGHVMRCGGYLSGLKRTKVRSWYLKDAIKIEDVAWADVIPLKEIMSCFSRYDLSGEQWKDIQHGRSIDATLTKLPTIAWYENLPIAILERKEGKAHPKKVL